MKAMREYRLQLVIIAYILLIGVVFMATIRDGQWLGSDFSLYMIHARNIVEGSSYSDTHYIYNPARSTYSPSSYPPVFPLLLAPVYAALGMDFTAMKIEQVLIFMAFLFVAFRLFISRMPGLHAAVAVVLLGALPHFWDFKENILSDIPFMLFVFINLLYLGSIHSPNRESRTAYPAAILAGVLMYLAFGTRTVGIVLIPCLVLFDVVRVRGITRFTVIATGVCAALVLTQEFLITDVKSYGDQMSFSLDIVRRNTVAYLRGLVDILYGGLGDHEGILLFVIASATAFAGFMARAAGRFTVIESFVLVYGVTILCWPVMQGMRFTMPLIPLFLFYVFSGVSVLEKRMNRAAGRILQAILVIPMLVSYAVTYARVDTSPLPEDFEGREITELVAFIGQNTAADDVFVLSQPRMLALLARRSSATFSPDITDAEQWEFFCSIGAAYIVDRQNSPWTTAYLDGFLERNGGYLAKVFENRYYRVSRIDRNVCEQNAQ